MKVLICYSGYLGTTKKIAYYIEEKLKEKNVDVDVIDLFETNKINYLIYDEIILGSCIRVGKPTNSFLKCIKKLNKLGREYNIFYLASKHSDSILDYLKSKAGELCQGYYYCGGEFRPKLAKGYAKIVTNAAIANLKYDNLDLPKLQYEEINNLIDKIINKKIEQLH